MRFCPFCSAESADDATQCSACARRLPPRAPGRRGTRSGRDRAPSNGPDSVPAQASTPAAQTPLATTEADEPALEAENRPPVDAAGPRADTESSSSEPEAVEGSEPEPGASTAADTEPEVAAPLTAEPVAAESAAEAATTEPVAAESAAEAATTEPAPASDPPEAATRPAADRVLAGPPSEEPQSWTPPVHSPDATPRAPTASESDRHQPVDVSLPSVDPFPSVPEPGILNAVTYALAITRARWQRRSAKKLLSAANDEDQAALDAVHLELGTQARTLGLRTSILAKENEAIDRAEHKRAEIEHACNEISSRQAEEESSFADSESVQKGKIEQLEQQREVIQREIDDFEARRRGAQEKLDTVERQQRGYLKTAEQRDDEAGRAAMGDARSGLRRAAEELRRDAAALEEEKLALERRLADLERPVSQAMARREDLQARLDAARRELQDARDGHRHRLAELLAEQNRRTRELSQADAEVSRHVTTLGTLVNLHRIEHPDLAPLYRRIDELRNAIGVRATESDRLTADSEGYDRDSYRRGYLILGGAALGLVLFILVLKVAL